MRNEVKMPPIIGAAIRRMTSEPVPEDHMMGTSPMNITATVITFGRRRLTAPSTIASLRRSEERRVGKSVDLGGRRIIKKKKNRSREWTLRACVDDIPASRVAV